MVLRLEAVTFEVADAAAVAAFWAGLLQREILEEDNGALVPGDPAQVGLRFVTSHTEQIGPRRLHLHLTSTSWRTSGRRSSRLCDWAVITSRLAKLPMPTSLYWPTRTVTRCA